MILTIITLVASAIVIYDCYLRFRQPTRAPAPFNFSKDTWGIISLTAVVILVLCVLFF